MRIWCIPKSTSLVESPCLPPRIDRDVFIRSPPPPPRLSKQEKLARGVIVYKTRRNKGEKNAKPPPHANSKTSSVKTTSSRSSAKPARKVRYADLEEVKPPEKPKPAVAEPVYAGQERVPPPHRGEVLHSRQQSNTSTATASSAPSVSSCLGTGSSSAASPASPQYSSSSGRGSSAEVAPCSPSPDTSLLESSSTSSSSSSSSSSSPQSTLTSLTSYRSRRSDRSSARSTRTRVKKTVTRSTLSLSVGAFSKLKKSSSCDDGAVILYPGISRTRERRDRGAKTKTRRKGVVVWCPDGGCNELLPPPPNPAHKKVWKCSELFWWRW